MAGGFRVTETLDHPTVDVWAYLTDFGNAENWMKGVGAMTQAAEGPLQVGTRFTFKSRGSEHETRVTALEPGARIELTSTQGGVTAVYAYGLRATDGGTEVTLDAVCSATGWWKLIHPLIAFAMKKADSSQLANLKAAMARRGA